MGADDLNLAGGWGVIARSAGRSRTISGVFPLERDDIACEVGELLAARGERVAVSETTAGGLISARMLSVAGASRWYSAGVVPYSGAHRWEQLGLHVEMVREHGAVSTQWVAATAEGLRRAMACDWALAESGIAGPQGSRRSPKPVGSVVIACAGPDGTRTQELALAGSRAEIMVQISHHALGLLRSELRAPES